MLDIVDFFMVSFSTLLLRLDNVVFSRNYSLCSIERTS